MNSSQKGIIFLVTVRFFISFSIYFSRWSRKRVKLVLLKHRLCSIADIILYSIVLWESNTIHAPWTRVSFWGLDTGRIFSFKLSWRDEIMFMKRTNFMKRTKFMKRIFRIWTSDTFIYKMFRKCSTCAFRMIIKKFKLNKKQFSQVEEQVMSGSLVKLYGWSHELKLVWPYHSIQKGVGKIEI